MKVLKISVSIIFALFISSNAFAGCAATAGFDTAMEKYNLAQLSESLQEDIFELSKDCKNVLHTGKSMDAISSCKQAIEIAESSS